MTLACIHVLVRLAEWNLPEKVIPTRGKTGASSLDVLKSAEDIAVRHA